MQWGRIGMGDGRGSLASGRHTWVRTRLDIDRDTGSAPARCARKKLTAEGHGGSGLSCTTRVKHVGTSELSPASTSRYFAPSAVRIFLAQGRRLPGCAFSVCKAHTTRPLIASSSVSASGFFESAETALLADIVVVVERVVDHRFAAAALSASSSRSFSVSARAEIL